ncbi:MAG: tetratricopeptide repeat protein [Bacteroidales bacterium]|nr:tetratricopeptide repeat protein [Bacteroidales bacterium]
MKKIALMLALVVIGYTAGAQSLNVSSAREAQNRGYFDKAKKLIDAACEHEQTRNDAKTWYYAGLIYSQIGGEAEKPKSKYKNLDPDWLIKCKSAALRCKELDTEKEYAEGNNTILSFVGNEYYKKAITAFNQQNWTEAMSLCDESIKIFNECGKKEYASESYLLAGKAAFNAQNNEAILKYLKPLVRTRSKDAFVYRTLFDIYKSSSDTNEAIKVAQNYAKAAKDDYNANMMLAEAYLLKGNLEEGNAEIQKALDKTGDKPEVHASLLAAAGAVFEGVNDFANAETRYKESLTALPNQFLANFGLGKMLYNRAVDKLTAANNVPPDDETVLYEKLNQESKDFFRQSIPYFTNAISFIDNLDEHGQATNRANLFHCLNALNTVYARLEMYDELKPIKARIDELKKEASN